MDVQDKLTQPTSGSAKDKKRNRRKWINKLRNELRLPGAPSPSPRNESQRMPTPTMSNTASWGCGSRLTS
ncbi:hypothetical protein PO903_14810 [Paenibacillus sp. PK4536]|uniref:Uncharacterized protein n=1 Tax=Paenibacillus nuruki TaxID=1886670 RepID=A0A1E3L8Z0_9BACL|nr:MULTISPECIES: hypothetical protein [Paenibacillus]ODP30173.1 hypothetical protein PTI45_00415 [Paenibacillus nuruki]TKJ91679.1 hypothetical protein PaeCFBP13512_10140 [Paenibacillus sp. CFBP13512]WIM37915.1 hypothetical protein PO903_14810 [Paenibacillus sp. PK4536]CAJ1315424.1 BHLH domain-containing protein [Paenibacillus nuruki]